jgi:hypothetical protein
MTEKTDGIRTVILFDVNHVNCPRDVYDEVERIWLDYELGNDTSYYNWTSDHSSSYYPIVDAYLKSLGITECLIRYSW